MLRGGISAHRERVALAIKGIENESGVREEPDQSSDNPERTAPGSYNPLSRLIHLLVQLPVRVSPLLIQVNTQTHFCFQIYVRAVGLPTGYTAGTQPRHLIKRPGCHGAPGENGV